MKVALTEWQGRVSPVLDTARALVIANVDDGIPIVSHRDVFTSDVPQEMAAQLRALGVELLVCGAVSQSLAECIALAGIRIIPFVSGDIEEVLQAVTSRRIPAPAFSMPGCGCRRRAGMGQGCGPGMGRGQGRVRNCGGGGRGQERGRGKNQP